jgi:hypothetical protein
MTYDIIYTVYDIGAYHILLDYNLLQQMLMTRVSHYSSPLYSKLCQVNFEVFISNHLSLSPLRVIKPNVNLVHNIYAASTRKIS